MYASVFLGSPTCHSGFFLGSVTWWSFSWPVGGGFFGVPQKLLVPLPGLPRTQDETQVHN